MIKERNIALCVILSIVTIGIYAIYWQVVMVNDLNTAANRPNDTSGIVVFLLTLVTCSIYFWYWSYQAGAKVQEAQAQRGLPADSNQGVIYLVLSVFGLSIVTYCLIQNELNKMANAQPQ